MEKIADNLDYISDELLSSRKTPGEKDPYEFDNNTIHLALSRDLTDRQIEMLNQGKSMSDASKIYSESDILYALEKYASDFRCRFPKEPLKTYLERMEGKRMLESLGSDKWILVPSGEDEI